MSVVGDAVRGVGRTASRAAEVTTEAAGAVGGAAVNGVIGGVQGVAAGVQRGLKNGSHSTPAAALTLGALGVAGLVEWPVLLAVGAGALVLRRLNPHPDGTRAPAIAPVKSSAAPSRSDSPVKAAPERPTGAANPAPSPKRASTRAKKTAARAPRGTQSRRTQ